MKKTNCFKTIILLFLTLLMCFTFTSCSLTYSVIKHFSNTPPEPTIKYAEFPFEVVYKLNGETVQINDVFVCEYDGIFWSTNMGYERDWKGFVKSTGERYLFIAGEDKKDGLYFALGSPSIYMGDSDCSDIEGTVMQIEWEDGGKNLCYTYLTDTQIWQKYNFKLISFTPSNPIENTFE